MAIIECMTQEEADAIPEPKHVWWNVTEFIVYTGDDIPVEPDAPV